MSDSVGPHRRQLTRLLHPWDSPGKNPGVGGHFLLQCMKVRSESEVTQLCPTLSDPMDCSPLGSSVHGIHSPPSKRLEWVAISTSRVSSRPTNKTQGSSLCLLHLWHGQAGFLPLVPPGKPHIHTAAAATAAKSHQSCPTLCDPIDGSSPGSSIPGILQARTLE